MFIFLKLESFRTLTLEPFGESFRENLLIKSRNQNICEKFKLNQIFQTIPFKMIYKCLCYVIGSQMNGGGEGARPEPPSSLIL